LGYNGWCRSAQVVNDTPHGKAYQFSQRLKLTISYLRHIWRIYRWKSGNSRYDSGSGIVGLLSAKGSLKLNGG
jgi:hypothetical protein